MLYQLTTYISVWAVGSQQQNPAEYFKNIWVAHTGWYLGANLLTLIAVFIRSLMLLYGHWLLSSRITQSFYKPNYINNVFFWVNWVILGMLLFATFLEAYNFIYLVLETLAIH